MTVVDINQARRTYSFPTAVLPKVPTAATLNFQFAAKFQPLFKPARYKVFWGGRGGAKSWSVARYLAHIAHTRKLRIGCFRELQTSIKDSVHRLLVDQIDAMGLGNWFKISEKTIVSYATGSEFLFKGLRHNASEIKSTEGIDVAWVEEAQIVSNESWEFLIPTIRKEDSEIIITFNAMEETDATYQRFIPRCRTCHQSYESVPLARRHAMLNIGHDMHFPPDNAVVIKVNWSDNPWFPKVLDEERRYMLKVDPAAYEHVWNGGCRIIGDAVIFKNKYVVEPFEAPVYPPPRFLYGLDFGFADDPMALMREWTSDNIVKGTDGKERVVNQDLWIDYEVYGHGIELDDMPAKFDADMPGVRSWPIKADNSRPESIRFLKRRGFMVSPATKWQGSVEDGIAYLKSFRLIHIHPRCTHQAQEARLYSWKIDKNQVDDKGKPVILPIPVDRHNHTWDADRYALDGYITRGGGGESVWARLGRAN